ncbi:hypothetical protein MRY82_01465 [bacterium]|nr:hypothetical protein [bacterium]
MPEGTEVRKQLCIRYSSSFLTRISKKPRFLFLRGGREPHCKKIAVRNKQGICATHFASSENLLGQVSFFAMETRFYIDVDRKWVPQWMQHKLVLDHRKVKPCSSQVQLYELTKTASLSRGVKRFAPVKTKDNGAGEGICTFRFASSAKLQASE